MTRKLIYVFFFLVFVGKSNSQIVNREPLSARLTGYRIDASLDPLSKTVNGIMEAFWINNSDDNVPDIQMHMYLNAFRSNRTTLYKEMGGSPGYEKMDLGWIIINSITRNGNSLSSRIKFISPDDGNSDDMTVLQIILPEPVKPGDTVFLKIDFDSKLPSGIRRTGFNEDFFFVGQWFPKFGVYEQSGNSLPSGGAWNCHQFHENSEFYSNHSVYDVNITVPQEYIVGSSGMLLKEMTVGKNKTLSYRAEDIVDFAWTAWPGYAVYEDNWKHVSITFLYPPERKDQVARQLQSVKNALEYLSDRVGPYPWPHLTFVDPPRMGNGAGGMEYTTLFTSLSSYGIPDFIHLPEMVTIHEFGHAYFMGILASNEFEEPWLDEGVNTFWEERIVDHYYGEFSGMIDHPLLKVSDKSLSRLSYVSSGSRQVVSNREYSWKYPHDTYSLMSYNKTGTVLYTLMGLVGEETIDEIFREYYMKWAFRHPSGNDFKNIVNEVVIRNHGDKFGADMNWFFDQTLYGTGIVDYKAIKIKNTAATSYKGLAAGNDSLVFVPGHSRQDSVYNTVVQIERVGEVMLPVEVQIHFTDNDTIKETWDGRERFRDFHYNGSRKADWVKIDPGYKIRMDVNFTNNSYTVKPDKIPVKSFTNKLILFMQFFINFISL